MSVAETLILSTPAVANVGYLPRRRVREVVAIARRVTLLQAVPPHINSVVHGDSSESDVFIGAFAVHEQPENDQ